MKYVDFMVKHYETILFEGNSTQLLLHSKRIYLETRKEGMLDIKDYKQLDQVEIALFDEDRKEIHLKLPDGTIEFQYTSCLKMKVTEVEIAKHEETGNRF